MLKEENTCLDLNSVTVKSRYKNESRAMKKVRKLRVLDTKS